MKLPTITQETVMVPHTSYSLTCISCGNVLSVTKKQGEDTDILCDCKAGYSIYGGNLSYYHFVLDDHFFACGEDGNTAVYRGIFSNKLCEVPGWVDLEGAKKILKLKAFI